MEESTGEGGLPVLKHKHGDATNFPPAAVLAKSQVPNYWVHGP